MDNTSTYSSNPNASLSFEAFQEAISTLKKHKRPVFWFTPFCPEDRFYKGEWIDKILDCSEYEEGYMSHPRYEKVLKEYYNKSLRYPSFCSFSDSVREPKRNVPLKFKIKMEG